MLIVVEPEYKIKYLLFRFQRKKIDFRYSIWKIAFPQFFVRFVYRQAVFGSGLDTKRRIVALVTRYHFQSVCYLLNMPRMEKDAI